MGGEANAPTICHHPPESTKREKITHYESTDSQFKNLEKIAPLPPPYYPAPTGARASVVERRSAVEYGRDGNGSFCLFSKDSGRSMKKSEKPWANGDRERVVGTPASASDELKIGATTLLRGTKRHHDGATSRFDASARERKKLARPYTNVTL